MTTRLQQGYDLDQNGRDKMTKITVLNNSRSVKLNWEKMMFLPFGNPSLHLSTFHKIRNVNLSFSIHVNSSYNLSLIFWWIH